MKQKKTTEDYLKTIYLLSRNGEVRGAQLAGALGVTRPTVCVSLKALESEGYLTMSEDRAVMLTESGKNIAKDTLERHMTLQELLLKLGVDKEIAARDACEMEHSVSPESFAALKQLVENYKKYERS